MSGSSMSAWSGPRELAAQLPARGAAVAEKLRWATNLATLAPSTHNTQPWRFESCESGVELHADGFRALPHLDPRGRELVISCGAALFNLRVAIRSLGLRTVVDLLPGGSEDSHLATLLVVGQQEVTAEEARLVEAIPRRHTNRRPLDAAGLSAGLTVELQDLATDEGAGLYLVSDEGSRRAMARLIDEAERQQQADVDLRREVQAWVRRPGEVAADGIFALAAAPAPPCAYATSFRVRDFGVVPAEEDWRVDDPLLAVLWTERDTTQDWLRAGQALEHVLLRATADGVDASFLNQPLEIPALRVLVRDELRLPGFPQLVLRLGGARAGPVSRRRLLDEVLS